MAKQAISAILDEISTLPLKEQLFVNETLTHRIHDSRRIAISNRLKEAEENHRQGKTAQGTPTKLFKELNNA